MTEYDPDSPLPLVVPRVTRDADGEPLIATQQVVSPNPMPRLVSILLVLVAVLGGGYIIYSQHQRNVDRKNANDKQQAQQDRFQEKIDTLLAKYKITQDIASKDREDLRRIVLILLADSRIGPAEKATLIQIVNRASTQDPDTSPAPAPHPSKATPAPTAQPSPSESPRPTPRSPSPTPSPTSTGLLCGLLQICVIP